MVEIFHILEKHKIQIVRHHQKKLQYYNYQFSAEYTEIALNPNRFTDSELQNFWQLSSIWNYHIVVVIRGTSLKTEGQVIIQVSEILGFPRQA